MSETMEVKMGEVKAGRGRFNPEDHESEGKPTRDQTSGDETGHFRKPGEGNQEFS